MDNEFDITNNESDDYKPIKKRRSKSNQPNINLDGKSLKDILGLANRMQRPDLSKYCIDSIPIEHNLYSNVVEVSPILRDHIKRGDDIIKTYNELSDDMFLSLYKAYPEMLDKSEVLNNYRINHGVLDELTEDPEYNVLRDYCQLDDFASAIASITLHENAIKRLEEIKSDIQEGENIIDAINEAISSEQNLQDILNNAKALQQLQDQITQQTGSPNDKLSQLEAKMKMDLAQAMKRADEKAKQFHKVAQDNPDQLRKITQAMTHGIDEAINRVSEANDLIEAWGFNPGPEIRVPIDSKIRAVEAIRKSKKLKKFSDLVGALKEMARKEQKTKSRHGNSNIKNVTVGNNLPFVLPSEKMLLNNKTTKPDFYKRYFENGLLQYELDHTERKGRGPLIVCVDISGSMEGKREIWAKAFAIALLEIAQIQRRNYCYISFESSIVDIVVQEKGYLDPQKIVEICEKSTRGGTDFEKPLNKSIEFLNDNRFKKGDIVFITDGECSVSTNFLQKYKEVKERKEFACRGILVNVDGSVSRSSLQQFCDDVVTLSDVTDLTEDSVKAQQIFRDL